MSSAAAADRGRPGPAPPPARVAPPRTLLLGMGNPILRDDGVGIVLARRIGARLAPADGLVVEPECTVGGLNLLELVAGFDRLIVLDSIKTCGGRPGDWYRFDGATLRDTMNLSNVHDANFATAMELGRRMGMGVPRETDIHVFAVEIQENLTFGERLSPELEGAVPHLCDELLGEIEELLAAAEIAAPASGEGPATPTAAESKEGR
jgi:hydrogenase maturation protease